MSATTKHAPKNHSKESGSGSKCIDPRAVRFNCSVLMLTSLGIAQLVVQWLISHIALLIAQVLIIFLCAFSHEWNFVHGEALTRHRRAYLNIANVLETYQPRARTMGHLFQPEPPTPGFMAKAEPDTEGGEKDEKQSEFMNQRDAHYAGMYTHAIQMNKEMDLMNKNAAACSSLDAAQLDKITLVPADPVKDKKEHEEKKKKEAEEYKKQFEKPFCC